MKDITIIFLTVNMVPEKWVEYHKKILLEAVDGADIITISKKPLDWGLNLIQDAEPSVNNIYRQILRAAKIATTPYIAIAEDDTLYIKEHFQFRPPLDTYAYNMTRWGLFTWGTPTYYYKERISNAAMIAPRELVISSLEERFRRYPNNHFGELGKEKGTRLDRKKTMHFYTTNGIVFLSHVNALDPTERSRRKRMGMVRAFDIPYWGKAKDIVSKFI
ncbi:MAG: hypothetical protein Q8L27_02455 [archaeon]|nr:hypothetical protein [archaeon]